jgi:hypothetical protein
VRVSARVAVGMSALTVLCLVGTCATVFVLRGPLADVAGCPRDLTPAQSGVVDDANRVHELLPGLGEIVSAHYRWREMRPRTCPDLGPMDFTYEGFAVLAAGFGQAWAWLPADTPTVPAELSPYAPAAPVWQRSPTLDADLHAQVWFDAGTVTVWFTYLRS